MIVTKFIKYYSYSKRFAPYLIHFLPALIVSWFVKGKKEYGNIWLVSERGDEARDNGFHFYKYVRTNYPDINAYYTITRDSPDYKKIKELGNVVLRHSFNHFLLFILCKKHISTHIYGAAPYGKACIPFLKLLKKKQHISLRHGITKDALKYSKSTNLDLYVCSSKFELECLKENSKDFKKSIKILGLCRFDKLIDLSEKKSQKRTLLLMPTFRSWHEDISRLANKDKHFTNDPFYTYWNNLLNSKDLDDMCEKYNLTIIFYPHYRVQKYIHNFSSMSESVIIADNKNYDIQDLLRKSSLLITDFSSVFFDFAYMKKPIIYYQFDKERYRKEHYKKGVFSYQDHGFGPVCKEQEEIINYINLTIQNRFNMEDRYLKRVDSFFEFTDSKNTERTFNEIMSLS